MKNLLKSILMLVLFSSAMYAQQITSVSPNNGLAGSQVTISGSGFSSTASENEVFFGKSKANVISVNAAGTELVVNTPTNPSYPFNINVFNASNTTWITSDVRFAFTYKAKINPTSRNFGDQYQSSTAELETFANFLLRRSLGDFKGAKLLATDFNGDKELDIYLQKDDNGGFPDALSENRENSVMMNENDIFTLSPQGNGGFTETESGTNNWDDPAIKQSGILSADLNNDGKEEVIVYGARVHSGTASKNTYFTPSFAILESNTSANSSSFSLTSSSNTPQNIFTITSNGGWDFPADQMNPINGEYVYGANLSNVQSNNPHIENSGDKLLYQTSVLAMEAVDIDKDGDLDIVALLSWPMLREEQVGSNRVNRAQIYIFKNTTTPGSSTFTFNNSQYKTGSSRNSQAVSGYFGLYAHFSAYSSHADWGNFLGPDKVIELQNSSFTGYDIEKWISDFKVSDLDDDGDFDIIVKGINEIASYSSRRIDTTVALGTTNSSNQVSLDWLYFRGLNDRSGLQAASGTGKGFLSVFKNNTTTGSTILSFTETTVDAAVANNKKFDFGGIDVCDIDNDGDKDIVIAAPDNTADTTANPNINIYLQSAGSFSQPVVLSAPTASTIPTSSQHMDNQGAVISRIKCVDLNGDNLKDILITGTNMDGLFSYMRLPAQTTISSSSYSIQNFLTAGTATAKFRAPFDVTIADFSNDGKVDLVVQAPLTGNSVGSPRVTYLKNNNGDPTILTNASLGIFTKCTNDPSGSQSLTIGGINISQAKGRQIKASVNSDYEICLDPTANNWSSNVLLSPDAYNDVEATVVFIRAKSSATTPVFTGTLTLTSPEAETVTFDLNGALDLPIGGTVSPAVQFVNTSNTGSTPATTTPAATSAPVAVTVSESFGTIQWQKSTDNSTWTDISGETTDTYTLPYAEIDNEGEVYLRAELTRCTEVAYSETALILENLGAPAPPSLAASNGQSISGTYDNGLTTKLEVYEDGTLIATCSDLVNGCSGWTFVNGTFTYTPSTGFTTGASITSKAYNSTVSSILSTAVIVDATAPTVPTINESNGTSITGTAEAGSTVSITYNSTTVTVVADASGNYTHYPQIPISDGSSITVTASDEVGNVSNSVSQNVDAVAPTITPDASDVNGVPLTGLSTLTGNTESGATVEVTLDDGTTYQVIADSNGDFTATFSPVITEGDNVYVTVTDQAGNTSSISTFVADGTAPSAPVANPSNGTVISGTGEAGSTVTFTYTVSGTQYSETAAVDGSGNYSFTPSVTIPDNTVVSVTNTDAVGNESASTDITTDGISPVITSIEDANGNAISNTSTVEGSTEPNSEITVTIGGTTYSGTADSDGNYSIDISAAGLNDGDSYTLIATDPAGNTSNTETVTVDDTAPTAPSVTEINGYVGTTISGSNAEPNSTITVSDGTNTWTTVANANGDYSVEISGSGLSHNDQLTITNTDAVGNTSTSTTTTLHLLLPVLTPSFTTNNQAQAGQTLEGNTDANAVVTAVLPGGTSITATADGTGYFSFDLSSYSLNDGDQISVTAENEYGNESTPLNWYVDETAPTANIYATDGTSFSGVLDGEGYTVSLAYGTPASTQNLTVTGSSFDWTPSSSLGLSVGDQVTYTITDEVGNETTYTITVQAEVYCIPAHSTGLGIGELTFVPGVSGASDVTFGTFLSDTYSDRTTTTTIELQHDAKPEFFARSASNTTVYYKIWVDYNQDGDFSDNGEAIDGSSTSQTLTSSDSLVFHSWSDISITNPLPDVPFENLADGSEYTMRIGLSSTAAGVSDPCGSSSATANFQDIKIKVLNCEEMTIKTLSDVSASGTNTIEVKFSSLGSTASFDYAIAKVDQSQLSPQQPALFSDAFEGNVDTWLSTNSGSTTTVSNLAGTPDGNGGYDFTFTVTADSEGNSLAQGEFYSVALTNNSCINPLWSANIDAFVFNVEIADPNTPSYATSLLSVESHTYTQNFDSDGSPDNTLILPVGEDLDLKTIVNNAAGNPVSPTYFAYFDAVLLQVYYDPNNTVNASNYLFGTLSSGLASTDPAVTTLIKSGTSSSEVEFTLTRNSAAAYLITFTLVDIPQEQPLDAALMQFQNAVNVAWYAPPALNTDNDGLTGCVPGETVTFELDGVTYSGTAGSDGTIAFTSLLNNGNALSGDDLSGLLNGSYSIGQTWTSGGATHTNTNQQLSSLSINAGSNEVTGTAAPGATVTLTIGDETFTTTADATTGIYDFSGTTSSSTAPSTGVDFNTLVPFTTTTAYTINQSLAGYTAAADVTGSILAATSDIAVPTISGALALTGTQTTVAGTAEAGSRVYLYDEDGNQLFDASGDPITATADDQGDYSITVDLSTAQISTGSNTFSAAYSSPYTGEVMQVGSTDSDGNTAPLSAAFVDPTVYVAGSTNITASSVIRFESNHTLGSGETAMAGLEIADGVTVTVPKDGCLDIAGSLAVQGTGSVSLGAAMNSGGSDVESAQLKFTGEYLGPPTLEMNGQLFKQAHTIGSPMKEGFVTSTLGDVDKLIGYDAYVDGEYYDAGESIATQGLGFYAIVGSSQFLAQSGGFDVVGSPMSALNMSLGYVSDNVSAAGSGWNMIANPYTCGWDWGASNPTNVATTFYIYDVANSSWKFWNSGTSTGTGLTSGVIPPLQGIWVQATSAGASVSSTMADDGQLTCASGSSQNGFLKTAIGKYKLTTVAQDDSADYAEMYLLDIAGAQQGFDADYDAWHMNGHLSRGKVYHAVGQEELVLNAMEIDSTTAVDIAFDSDHMNKTYRLELSTEAVDTTLEVLLEDRYEGGLWSLDKGAYVFEHIARPVGVKQTRFELRFVQKSEQTIGEQEQDLEAGVQVAGNTLTIQHPDRYVSYQIFDAQGRTIANAVVTPTIVLPTEQWPNGIYRIVLLGAQTTTVSIVVQH